MCVLFIEYLVPSPAMNMVSPSTCTPSLCPFAECGDSRLTVSRNHAHQTHEQPLHLLSLQEHLAMPPTKPCLSLWTVSEAETFQKLQGDRAECILIYGNLCVLRHHLDSHSAQPTPGFIVDTWKLHINVTTHTPFPLTHLVHTKCSQHLL